MLNELAYCAAMAGLLAGYGPLTITEMASVLGRPRGTVATLVRHDCSRHGVFRAVGTIGRGRGPTPGGNRAKLYDLIDSMALTGNLSPSRAAQAC